MACASAASPGALFQALREVRPQCREGRSQAAQHTAQQRQKQIEDSHPCIERNGVDARHRFRQQVQSCTDGGSSKPQSHQASGQAEHQSFKHGFTKYHTRTRAQRQPHRIFPPPPDRPHQQQPGDIGARNQQHHGHSQEQRSQQRTHVRHNIFQQRRDYTLNVDSRHMCRKVVHHDLRHPAGILRGLRERSSILKPGYHVVSPKAGVRI